MLGGIEAVIWTDVVQSLILIVGALLITALVVFGMPEGPTQALSIAWENHKFSLGSFGPGIGEATFWVVLFYGIFINLNNFGIDQSFVQRYHTARSSKEARKSLWIGSLLYLPISLLFFFIGSSLFSYYQVHPDMLYDVKKQVAETTLITERETARVGPTKEEVEALTDADIGDKVLPHFIANKFPAGLAGLLIAAIFAAAMSSIDTSLNSSSTIVLSDIYKRYVNPDADERTSMFVLRASTLVWGLIGTGVALAMIRVKSILDAWWQLQGIFAGGMLGLFLLGLISRRAEHPAAATGLILGVLVIAWMTFSPRLEGLPDFLRSPFHTNMIIVIGTLSIFLIGLVISRLTRSK